MDLIVLHKSLSPVQDRILTAVVRVTDLPRMLFSKKGMYIASKAGPVIYLSRITYCGEKSGREAEQRQTFRHLILPCQHLTPIILKLINHQNRKHLHHDLGIALRSEVMVLGYADLFMPGCLSCHCKRGTCSSCFSSYMMDSYSCDPVIS